MDSTTITQRSLDLQKSSSGRKQPVKVRCIETGEVFESIRMAMEMTGVSRRAIYHAITNEAGGFHWEAVDDERTFF